jgi:predicted MFS family arabinose efflux permease
VPQITTSDSTRSALNFGSIIALIFANGILTISQVSIASVYLPISISFNEEITGLGILSSIFFVGFGLAETPSGLLSSRIGPKKVLLLGATIIFLTVLLSAFSPTFEALVALRFMVGIGLGLTVPSTVVLTMRSVGRGSAGTGVGLVAMSSNVGAGLGIFGWSILSALYGWRASLVVDSLITGAVALLVFLLVPADVASSERSFSFKATRTLLANRKLQAVGLAMLGSGITGVLTGNFLVYYLEKVFDLQPGYAGSIAGAGYVAPIFTSIIIGRIYDRGLNAKLTIFGATVVLGLGTAIISIHSVYTGLAGVLICGVSSGPIGIVAFTAARRIAPSPNLEALSIGFVDSFALIGVFLGALSFPFLVLGLGYPVAWIVGGVVCIILTFPVLLLKDL